MADRFAAPKDADFNSGQDCQVVGPQYSQYSQPGVVSPKQKVIKCSPRASAYLSPFPVFRQHLSGLPLGLLLFRLRLGFGVPER